MQRVFGSYNPVEAHLVAHMLEEAGIKVSVTGEHLMAARGDLPAIEVTVSVLDNDDYDPAVALINQQNTLHDEVVYEKGTLTSIRSIGRWAILLVMAAFGCFVLYKLLRY